MKKNAFFLLLVGFVCGLFSLSFTKCKNSGGDNYVPADTVTYSALSDSLSMLMGQQAGYHLLSQMGAMKTNDSTFDADQYIKGIETVLAHRYPMAYLNGLHFGLDVSADLNMLADSGIDLNRKALVKNVQKDVNAGLDPDSIGTKRYALSQQYSEMMQRIMDNHFVVDKSQQDSLQTIFTQALTYFIGGEIENYDRNNEEKFDREAFFKGFDKIAGKKHNPSYINGMYTGFQFAQNLIMEENSSINIRRETLVKEIKDILAKNENDQEAMEAVSAQLGELMDRIYKEKQEAEEARLSQTPEAIQNVKTGEAMVDKVKNENPNAKTTESGLTYIILNPGTEPKIAATDRVNVKYKGTHLDGQEFDQNDGATFGVTQLIPGFSEGLQMLGKGGKAIFYIPGNIAYGAHGAPQAGIGPMETLVFEVEINDIIAQ